MTRIVLSPKRMVAGVLAALLVALVLPLSVASDRADATLSSNGWTNGAGIKRGIGNGIILNNFYSYGVNAAYLQKWLGALNPNVASNEPSAIETDLWCIEGGTDLATNASYSWTTATTARTRYLMWLTEKHPTFTTSAGRGATTYLLYSIYATRGDNDRYASRIMAHSEFTATAKSVVTKFNSLSSYSNTAATLTVNRTANSVPGAGTVSGIGVRDAWGDYISGLPYTLTISGPATFNSNGAKTVTGTTASSVRNAVHAWTATGSGSVSISITYPDAQRADVVYIGSNSSYQDVVAGGAFTNLTSAAPSFVTVGNPFLPGGDSRVTSTVINVGQNLTDTFTTAAVSGTWLRNEYATGGPYIPVTYDVAVYYAGMTPPASSSTTVPGSATLVATRQVTASGPGVTVTANMGAAPQSGFYVYVWSFSRANQPAANRPFFIDQAWADRYGLEDEVTSVRFAPRITSVASSTTDGDGDMHFTDTLTASGFPANHGTFTGNSVFGADAQDVTLRLYFFPEGVTVSDSNLTGRQVGSAVTFPATNGTVTRTDPTWVTVRDGDGFLVPGTYAFRAVFTGDDRALAYSSSVTEVTEQIDVQVERLVTSTTAHSSGAVIAGTTIDVWDVADVTGDQLPGFEIGFSLYGFADAQNPVCTPDTLIHTYGRQPLTGADQYTSEPYSLTVPALGAIGFVETVWNAEGDAVLEGICGAQAETLDVTVVPLTLSTTAHSNNEPVAGTAIEVTDTASIAGYVPAGATVEWDLYEFQDATVPECTADTLVGSVPRTAINPAGATYFDTPTDVVSDGVNIELTSIGALSWIATVRDSSGDVIEAGDCGEASETLQVFTAPLEVHTTAAVNGGTVLAADQATVFDTAFVAGYVPADTTIEWDLYQFADVEAPECTSDTLLASVDPVLVTDDGRHAYYEEAREIDSAPIVFRVPNVGAIGFVETLRDADGNILHSGVCGAASETLAVEKAPLTVATVAHASVDTFQPGDAVEFHDEASILGYVPEGATIEFALYWFNVAADPICTPGTLIDTTDAVLITEDGTHAYAPAESPLLVASPLLAIDVPDAPAVGFVETVRDVDGNVLAEGACGEASETLSVQSVPPPTSGGGSGGNGGGLSQTGANVQSLLLATGALIAAGGVALVIGRRFGRTRAQS